MSVDSKTLLKSLSVKVVSKVVQTFDQATAIVVGACWGAALIMMLLALYTISLSVSSKRASEAALIAEPLLPQMQRQNIDIRTLQALFERLQKRYPDIAFSMRDQTLIVSSSDGARFRQWITALSYVDTISPELHWSIQELCVGKCSSSELMRATLAAERITFVAPDLNDKN